MGWFGTSDDEKRKEEVRTGARAPDRTERKRCWDARDGFYRCLDKNDVVDSLNGDGKKIADKECATEHKAFEENCATAWVTYFKRYRVAEHKKKETYARLEKEGANRIAVDGPGDTPRS
ncbi:cytochrome oxidase c subunit VIb-domain-containing protein [Hypoxylon sp. FL1150]|nr:cytochrome oxidase c subunit VIb-domain-containing protein [Hypoxylon sp. FL1150]